MDFQVPFQSDLIEIPIYDSLYYCARGALRELELDADWLLGGAHRGAGWLLGQAPRRGSGVAQHREASQNICLSVGAVGLYFSSPFPSVIYRDINDSSLGYKF